MFFKAVDSKTELGFEHVEMKLGGGCAGGGAYERTGKARM